MINKSNSGVPGTASSPKIDAFNESASMVNGTDSCSILGCDFNNLPVVAEPVNVITSWLSTVSKMFLAVPEINCNAPSGNILDAIISLTTASVK